MRFALFWLSLLMTLAGCEQPPPNAPSLRITELLGGVGAEGFARATTPRPFQFPADHGPHRRFRNEWWYLTGHLHSGDGRAFGFQVTLFRVALRPEPLPSPSAWRSNQIWMAHAALSDLSRGTHQAYERFSREALGLAGSSTAPLQLWVDDWRLQRDSRTGSWQLRFPTPGFTLSLTLDPDSPIVAQGDNGLSRKSDAPGNASYYYSIPRLTAAGRLRMGGADVRVEGSAWLDREWSSSALDAQQSGWDWFSLQLIDGRNLMYYRLRRSDGRPDPHSAGSLSDRSGLLRRLGPDQVTLTPLAWWEVDERRYPVQWRLELPGEAHPWRVRALMDDQEMRLSVRYWEGAVEVVDEHDGTLLGKGYLEMTGYD